MSDPISYPNIAKPFICDLIFKAIMKITIIDETQGAPVAENSTNQIEE